MVRAGWMAAMGAAGLALAGCGGGATNDSVAADANIAAEAGSNFQAEVAALEPAQQRIVMFRAIRDAGLPCQEVVSATIEADMTPQTWRAVCEDDRNHLVTIQPSGDATVLSGR